jgi:hypothetical protein
MGITCGMHDRNKECLEIISVRYEVFILMKIQVTVFWVLTVCSDMIQYHSLEGLCYLHLQGHNKFLVEKTSRKGIT